MNKDQYRQYLNSSKWKAIAKRIKTRDDYRCRLCNSGLDLHVHHRDYSIIGREDGHFNELVTLCARCHATFHCKAEDPKLKPKPTATNNNPDGPKLWSRKKLKKQQAYYERAHANRNALISDMAASGAGTQTMDSTVIDLCLTFSCGLHQAARVAFNFQKHPKGGWKKRLRGKSFPTKQIIDCLKATDNRERRQIQAGRTCNV